MSGSPWGKLQAAVRARKAGMSEDEVRSIIRTNSGCYQHEVDAVFLRLHSSSPDFNAGRDACLEGKMTSEGPGRGDYQAYIMWHTGYDACNLAIKLHGRKAVTETL